MIDILDVNRNPPAGVKVLPNGAWQNKETGKIVKAAPGQAWDSKKASEMAKRRWEKVKAKTREGIRDAVQAHDPGKAIQTFPDAHKEVVTTLMTDVVLNDKVKGKQRVDSYTALLAIEGSVKTKQELGGVGSGMTITFSADVAKHMMDRLLERQNRGEAPVIIEAEA